jgi:hypothetical protein
VRYYQIGSEAERKTQGVSMKIVRAFVWRIVFTALACNASSNVAQQPWSQRMANEAIERWPDGRFMPEDKPRVWNYELGTLLSG